MKFKSTWIVIALFLGLGSYWYFVEEPQYQAKQEAQAKEGLLFPNFDSDQVTELTLQVKGTTVRVKKGEGNKWFTVTPWEDRADDGRVRTLLGDLKGLKTQREVAGADADLKPFGLDAPEAVVTAAGSPAALAVGAQNPAGDSRYVRGGDGPVRLAQASSLSGFLGKPDDLRDKELLGGFPWTRLVSVEIRRPGGEAVHLEKKGEDQWAISAPNQAEADPDAVNRLTEKIRWGRVNSFLEKDPVEAEKALAAGTTVILKAEGGDETTLRLAEVDGSVWAAHSGRKALFTVGKDVLEAVGVSAQALRRNKPVLVKSWKTNRVELEMNAGADKLAYNKVDGGWNREGAKVEGPEAAALQDYLRALETTAATEVIDPPGPPAEYGLDAPVLSTRLVDTDGAEQRLTVSRKGEGVFARAGDAGPVYRMPADYLAKADAVVAATKPAPPSSTEAKPEGAAPAGPRAK
jgi:hypothetical protein